LEVIIVDDSPVGSVKEVADSLSSRFKSISCTLKYVKGNGDGLPAARNLSAKICEGDAILFLDDDTFLDQNVVSALATFIRGNPKAIGVQPKILFPKRNIGRNALAEKLENAVYKVAMLTYGDENRLAVRKSAASIFPNSLTKVITAQRLSGCCCCYKREVLTRLSFDDNLKRWGFMEDLDFSFRVYKTYPQSLYSIPHAKIIHKLSGEARLPTKLSIYMVTVYWFYVFFKDIFEGSILNLIAFLWALTGNLACILGGLIIKRKPRNEWWGLIYLLESYATAFRNLKNIRMLKLGFFNKNLRVA
jgi:GT2 family glycosyltransferase